MQSVRQRIHGAVEAVKTLSATGNPSPEEVGHPGRVRRICPRCNGWVYRVRRRFVDLLLSTLIPVQRYRCFSTGCDWEGNMRVNSRFLPSVAREAPNDGSSAALGPPQC